MSKLYRVQGLLKMGNRVEHFSTTVTARSARVANRMTKNRVATYCETFYSDREPVKCIINKKTARCN